MLTPTSTTTQLALVSCVLTLAGCPTAAPPHGAFACADDADCREGSLCAVVSTTARACGVIDPSCPQPDSGCLAAVRVPALGCLFAPISEGGACTVDACGQGTCRNGACLRSPGPVCDDGRACTIDTCDAVTGCRNSPDGTCPCTSDAECQSEDKCVGTFACRDGNCVAQTPPVDCSALEAVCGRGVCYAATGNCDLVPREGACDDGDPCTDGDRCQDSLNCAGEPVDCDDDDPCTADACTPGGNCDHTPLAEGSQCDDGNACTVRTVCQSGVCSGGEPQVWQAVVVDPARDLDLSAIVALNDAWIVAGSRTGTDITTDPTNGWLATVPSDGSAAKVEAVEDLGPRAISSMVGLGTDVLVAGRTAGPFTLDPNFRAFARRYRPGDGPVWTADWTHPVEGTWIHGACYVSGHLFVVGRMPVGQNTRGVVWELDVTTGQQLSETIVHAYEALDGCAIGDAPQVPNKPNFKGVVWGRLVQGAHGAMSPLSDPTSAPRVVEIGTSSALLDARMHGTFGKQFLVGGGRAQLITGALYVIVGSASGSSIESVFIANVAYDATTRPAFAGADPYTMAYVVAGAGGEPSLLQLHSFGPGAGDALLTNWTRQFDAPNPGTWVELQELDDGFALAYERQPAEGKVEIVVHRTDPLGQSQCASD